MFTFVRNLWLLAGWGLLSNAQTTGALIVHVVSEGRAPVSQAKARLENPVQNRVVGLETTSDGALRAGNLSLSVYRLTVDAPGFESAIQTVTSPSLSLAFA